MTVDKKNKKDGRMNKPLGLHDSIFKDFNRIYFFIGSCC